MRHPPLVLCQYCGKEIPLDHDGQPHPDTFHTWDNDGRLDCPLGCRIVAAHTVDEWDRADVQAGD